MARLKWDDRSYEMGVDRGVFFPSDGPAEAWNGLVSVDEKSINIEGRVRYRDGVKVGSRQREDSFSASVVTFSYPLSFLTPARVPFGFSYRIKNEKSYRIHLVYNALAHMTERSYGQSDSTPFAFDITTRPVAILDAAPAAHVVVDAEFAPEATLAEFESVIYGTDTRTAHLPTAQEVVEMFDLNAIFKVIDNGDGTFTIDGPDEAIRWLDGTTFQLNWPKVVFIDEETYRIRSW